MSIKVCVFDAYGTLFDVSAAAREAAARPENTAIAGSWQRLATDWRVKQLEYSWLRAITGEHADFWRVTEDGLDWALAAQGLADAGLRARLMELYRHLAPYPEAAGVLARLKQAGFATAILSNGTPAMLADAVDAAGFEDVLDAVLSVEDAGIYKPARAVYALVPERFACAPGEVLFVSSNGWDVAGAGLFGFVTAWVNRAGLPLDRFGPPPRAELRDLARVPEIAEAI